MGIEGQYLDAKDTEVEHESAHVEGLSQARLLAPFTLVFKAGASSTLQHRPRTVGLRVCTLGLTLGVVSSRGSATESATTGRQTL